MSKNNLFFNNMFFCLLCLSSMSPTQPVLDNVSSAPEPVSGNSKNQTAYGATAHSGRWSTEEFILNSEVTDVTVELNKRTGLELLPDIANSSELYRQAPLSMEEGREGSFPSARYYYTKEQRTLIIKGILAALHSKDYDGSRAVMRSLDKFDYRILLSDMIYEYYLDKCTQSRATGSRLSLSFSDAFLIASNDIGLFYSGYMPKDLQMQFIISKDRQEKIQILLSVFGQQ